MKPYYSIVSIATNPSLNEKFNIGLLCVTGETTFFHFSDAKFKIVSKLLSPNARKLALSALKGMEEQINETQIRSINSPYEQQEAMHLVAEPYIAYLNRYNNNLVQYSNTVKIDMEIDYTVFKTLFKKYIFSEEVFDVITEQKKPSFTSIRNHFRKAARPYANTNFNVTREVIKDMIAPVNVDVFGKNGAFVSGQSLDFSKNAANLQSKITSFFYLTEHTLKEDRNSRSFVLGDEPSKEEILNHQIWKNVRNSEIVEFVPTNESERIISFMQENGVAPIK